MVLFPEPLPPSNYEDFPALHVQIHAIENLVFSVTHDEIADRNDR
jgi:hypothetical protein